MNNAKFGCILIHNCALFSALYYSYTRPNRMQSLACSLSSGKKMSGFFGRRAFVIAYEVDTLVLCS